ncbi:DUF4810 domain-containing protein [Bowmanella sp. Y26]|uniref:DUF4810 domain-containing protein n=1 Tax=Bowmanella yangjiangensis TaxID=2811230 RepID=UPI001BDD190F|nr:DUF4810 domain-containing protein [Bowmanella yangjiangensis]MBT1064194.1 DUF4810 domain-containing protein [Bowmanella yangjiangensis]
MRLKLLILTPSLLLGACKTTEPLYYYGSYPQAVYQYISGESSVNEQILSLQQTLSTAKSEGLPVAPGIHAHLGMLYMQIGDEAAGYESLITEKTLFPESAQYIDLLLQNNKNGTAR